MFHIWNALAEFCDLVMTMEDCHQTTGTANDDVTNEAETNNKYMDDETTMISRSTTSESNNISGT
jgi:hypothetical protein